MVNKLKDIFNLQSLIYKPDQKMKAQKRREVLNEKSIIQRSVIYIIP